MTAGKRGGPVPSHTKAERLKRKGIGKRKVRRARLLGKPKKAR